MSEIKSFLGTGWSYPVTFNKASKQVKMVSEELDIEQSLKILLSTTPGERPTNPNYGCGIANLAFESLTPTTEFLLRQEIDRAILYYEPRITLNEIEIDKSRELDGIVFINLDYTVRKINIRSNMVYPFYKLEGTLVNDDLEA